MGKKIMCNFAVEEETLQRLGAMASADMRSRTQEVNWLIEQAFKARADLSSATIEAEDQAAQVME